MATVERLDVTKIEPRLKHPTIFKYFDALQPGEELVIENDHDPKPLYYELIGERGNIFTWEYLEKGPELFVVKICKNPAEEQKEIERLNVTAIEPKFKHPTIFKYFDALKAGESFIIENDHDPKPLYYELIAERGDIFTWEYLQKGPELFEVQIAKNPVDGNGEETIGSIAAKDIRKAQMLKEKGINFSCNGDKTVKEASAEAGISEDDLRTALNSTSKTPVAPSFDYDKWELDFLVDYIVNTHHRYIKDNSENLNDLAIKVAEHHGDNHPELNRLSTVTYHFLQDLLDNTVKEERVLFPVIKEMVAKQRDAATVTTYKIGSLHEPINLLRKEHEIAMEDLAFFRKLTNNYALPEDACNSYRYLFEKLQEFENDLQMHIHLENNILFPKALQQDLELAKLN
ncbi:DUF542 domain-containing protein [Chryseobacterium sp. SNU WT5]|uniref:DUF542 domain-containing protein n=1 Tax=Chryseobacterium sp. SNU WT5 TaxID=2594269 RepID=UPI001E2A8DEC|nr:DUF542 domain-containing protein [Chryseobacterium sp. SNU WT5]